MLKLPNNEEELFELKTYARSIPSLKQNLLERENDITNHTYILEDYLFPLDLREYAKLFNCKTWPFEIDASTKDGLQKLEE